MQVYAREAKKQFLQYPLQTYLSQYFTNDLGKPLVLFCLSAPCLCRLYHTCQGARRLDLTIIIAKSKKGAYYERQKKIISI